MVCSKCGKNNPDDARFCDGCGNSLQADNQQQNYSAPPPPPAQQYQQPQYQQQGGYTPVVDNSPLSVGQFVGMYLLTMIPIVGFILIIVWAFSGDSNTNKKNWARAMLLIMLIGIALAIILSVALGGFLLSLMNSMAYY